MHLACAVRARTYIYLSSLTMPRSFFALSSYPFSRFSSPFYYFFLSFFCSSFVPWTHIVTSHYKL